MVFWFKKYIQKFDRENFCLPFIESDMSEDFLAANVVASAWGVDMIMSKENPEIIFRKHEMKNEWFDHFYF